MKRALPVSLISGLIALAACVTINVYFPAAAAEKAADRIIDDVWGTKKDAVPATPQSRLDQSTIALALLNLVISPAEAQQPNLDLSSPEIQRITATMEARHSQLQPWFDSGAVGLAANGDVALRDAASVPLASRNAVSGLVKEENADRGALYRQIAIANGQPQWEAQIRSVFAQRWVARAKAGWWYQDSSGWKQR